MGVPEAGDHHLGQGRVHTDRSGARQHADPVYPQWIHFNVFQAFETFQSRPNVSHYLPSLIYIMSPRTLTLEDVVEEHLDRFRGALDKLLLGHIENGARLHEIGCCFVQIRNNRSFRWWMWRFFSFIEETKEKLYMFAICILVTLGTLTLFIQICK